MHASREMDKGHLCAILQEYGTRTGSRDMHELIHRLQTSDADLPILLSENWYVIVESICAYALVAACADDAEVAYRLIWTLRAQKCAPASRN